MSDKVKIGLVFGITMTIFFIAQHLLFSDNITSKEIFKSIISGVIGGAVAGFLFVWLMVKIGNSKFIKKGIKIEIDPNEKLIFETGANHFKGIEAVGGKLVVEKREEWLLCLAQTEKEIIT